MLERIKINNIALISESEIDLKNGLNILTGETGAGKSLIIDSLNFVLGARADKNIIKHGESQARVEAVFNLQKPNDKISLFFDELGAEYESNIIISRVLSTSGKNDVRVNGFSVTNNMLKSLTSELVDIHGQHSHQSLLDVKNHISILDSFKSFDVDALKEKIKDVIIKIKSINQSVKALGGIGEDKQRNIDIYNHQINEIESANLVAGEDDELLIKKHKMQNYEKIFDNISSVSDSISTGDFNVLSVMKKSLNLINSSINYDEKIEEFSKKASDAYYQILDLGDELSSYLENVFYDEDELNSIEERLDLINGLKRKYGKNIEDVIEYQNKTKNILDDLINSDKKIESLMKEKSVFINNLYNLAVELTDLRKSIALQVESLIIEELKDLGMKNATFKVNFANSYDIDNVESVCGYNGGDNVEFLFSANLGEPVKPLSKIISGGEMSRFMLAVKCVINNNLDKTFIFDEIDNGIGGVVGQVVAQKLHKISIKNQVVCVTHLAQIASYADVHFKIEKTEYLNSTESRISALNSDDKIIEISRLLGSESESEIGKKHAIEMIDLAKTNKVIQNNVV